MRAQARLALLYAPQWQVRKRREPHTSPCELSVRSWREDSADCIQQTETHMRRIVIILPAALVSALAGAGTAAAAGTPQSPQSGTDLISCPGIASFLAADIQFDSPFASDPSGCTP